MGGGGGGEKLESTYQQSMECASNISPKHQQNLNCNIHARDFIAVKIDNNIFSNVIPWPVAKFTAIRDGSENDYHCSLLIIRITCKPKMLAGKVQQDINEFFCLQACNHSIVPSSLLNFCNA